MIYSIVNFICCVVQKLQIFFNYIDFLFWNHRWSVHWKYTFKHLKDLRGLVERVSIMFEIALWVIWDVCDCAWYIDLRRHEEIDLASIFPYKFYDIRFVEENYPNYICFDLKKITFQWKIDPKYKSFVITFYARRFIGNWKFIQNPVAVLLISSSMNRVMNERHPYVT